MNHALLTQLIRFLPPKNSVISAVGAGGKTTCLYGLARMLIDAGATVLITTTTKLFHPDQEGRSNYHLVVGDFLESTNRIPNIKGEIDLAVLAEEKPTNKLTGFAREQVQQIKEQSKYDYILVEADGAKQKPIKAPAAHEPVIPEVTQLVIGIIGLDSLGCTLEEKNVHRADHLAAVSGQSLGSQITEKTMSSLILSEQGLFKGTPVNSARLVILNKAETPELLKQGGIIRDDVMKRQDTTIKVQEVLIGALR